MADAIIAAHGHFIIVHYQAGLSILAVSAQNLI